MDHSEVRRHLADALAAGTLPSLLEAQATTGTDGSGEGVAGLHAHVDGCGACRAEADALLATGALLAAATPDDVLAPVAARERVLRAVRETGMVRGTAPLEAPAAAVRPLRRWSLPGLAAVGLAAVIVAGVVTVADLGEQRDAAQAEVAALAELTSASASIMARPDHAQLGLATTAGAPGGMVVYSAGSGRLAVWSRALDGGSAATGYDCYVLHGGALTLIGWMEQAGTIAYWVGQVPPGVTLGRAGDRIIVAADEPDASPTLSGTF